MTTRTENLARLGIALPHVTAPVGRYQPAVLVDSLIFTSGQLPIRDAKPIAVGKVGAEVSVEHAREAAAVCALNAVAAAAELAGGLEQLARVIKITGFVASAPGFTGQADVLNGASELLGEIFGADGVHARSAVGVAELPLGLPVEVEVVFRVH